MVQMGSLKRAREDAENPGAVRERSAQKKARYELAKRSSSTSTRKRKRHGEGSEGYATFDEMPEVPEGPKILTRAEYLVHPTSTQTPGASSSSSSAPRSILRKTSPVRLVSHNREHWLGSHLDKSPKLGPRDLHVPTLGKRVMLGVHYDRYVPEDENMDEGTPSGLFPSTGDSHLNPNMMALATLGLSAPRASIGPINPISHARGSGVLDSLENPQSTVAPHSPTSSDEEGEVEDLVRPIPTPMRIDLARQRITQSSSLSAWMGALLRRIY